MIFLIEYSRRDGRIIDLKSFEQSERPNATTQRLTREIELSRQGIIDREVVLLDAESEAALRETHARYFSTLEELTQSAIAEAERATHDASAEAPRIRAGETRES